MDDKEREQKRIDDAAREMERKKWLLSVTDMDAERLPVSDRYDRIRYLRQILADEILTQAKSKPSMHWNREWKNVYQ